MDSAGRRKQCPLCKDTEDDPDKQFCRRCGLKLPFDPAEPEQIIRIELPDPGPRGRTPRPCPFWTRIGASFIDASILIVPLTMNAYVFHTRYLVWGLALIFIIAREFHSPGRHSMGLVMLMVSDHQSAGSLRRLLRALPLIVPALVGFTSPTGENLANGEAGVLLLIPLLGVPAYLALDFLVKLITPHRRGILDFIAGTVLVPKQ